MKVRPPAPRRWLEVLQRTALMAVCLLALQQCSTPVGAPTEPTPNPTPQPPSTPPPDPPPPGPETFVGAGDIALCDGTATAQEATAKLLDTIGGTVFTLGDNAYPNGSRENFNNCYDKSWGRHKARTRPAPGNHEYNSANAQFYYEYFGALAGPAGAGYYSYNLGAWHIISLNSDPSVVNGAGGPAQEAWLRADLAANATTKCTLAYWHHPLFTSSQNRNNPHMRSIYKILYDAGAEVVLTGHDHSYERFAPQDPDGRPDPARGIREWVVGTGGTLPMYEFIAVQPNSEARVRQTYGVLKMTLSADGYSAEFINTSHQTLDTVSATCH